MSRTCHPQKIAESTTLFSLGVASPGQFGDGKKDGPHTLYATYIMHHKIAANCTFNTVQYTAHYLLFMAIWTTTNMWNTEYLTLNI